MKKITLPKSMEPQARQFAEVHCEILGLGPKDKAYSEEFKKAFYEFCYEAYMHSLTPSGQMGQNPSSKKIQDQYLPKLNELLKVIKIPADRRDLIFNQIKSVIVSLTHIYLTVYQGKFNYVPQVKGSSKKRIPKTNQLTKKDKEYRVNEKSLRGYTVFDGKLIRKFKGGRTQFEDDTQSSFQYKKGMKGQYDKLLEVEKARYKRVFIATIVTKMVYDLLTMEIPDDPLSSKYISGIDSSYFQENENAYEKFYKKLRSPETKIKFIDNINRFYDSKEGFKSTVKVVKKEESKPSSKSSDDVPLGKDELNDYLRKEIKQFKSKNGKMVRPIIVSTKSGDVYVKRMRLVDDQGNRYVPNISIVDDEWLYKPIKVDGDFFLYNLPALLDEEKKRAKKAISQMPLLEDEKVSYTISFQEHKRVVSKINNARVIRYDQMTYKQWAESVNAMIESEKKGNLEPYIDYLAKNARELKDQHKEITGILKTNPRVNLKKIKIVKRRRKKRA